MLQINNLEGKSDWINESQLVIPMVGNEDMSPKEMDGISKHTITLNSIEGGDQTLLTNASGQTFVIGLDQTLFENYTNKSDLLLMSNSDLKLLPSVSDSKLAYALPSIDQSKSEILWESNAFEKPLTKDILNVIQETSKGWQEMGKNSEICLDDINSVEVHDNKLNTDFLIEPHMAQSKKLRTDSSDQYIVGYYPVVESCDTVLVPTSLMTIQQKGVDNEQTEKAIVIGKNLINNGKSLSQLFGNENVEVAQSVKWIKSESSTVINDKVNSEGRVPVLKMNNTQKNTLILTKDNINNLNETVIPLINPNQGDFINAKSKNYINFNNAGKCTGKNDGKVVENENHTLPEQSLPLKKKAKMKKSPLSGNSSFLACDTINMGKSFAELHYVNGHDDVEGNASNSPESGRERDSEEHVSNRCKRKSNGAGAVYGFKKKKKGEEEKDSERVKWSDVKQMEETNENGIRYDNIKQLLQQLQNEKYINEAVFKILEKGLEEMDVDVLQEMYTKRDDGNASPHYSNQLKAFALIIHFKQPTAFNRLRQIFHKGWPPLAVIKDWKRRLNNRRRPNMNK